jgi:hypothetical protein
VRHWAEYDVTDPEQLYAAFRRAIRHYQRNYAEQWEAARA